MKNVSIFKATMDHSCPCWGQWCVKKVNKISISDYSNTCSYDISALSAHFLLSHTFVPSSLRYLLTTLVNFKKWVSGCAHCAAYDMWWNIKSKIYFKWKVTVTFWIMNVKLWSFRNIITNHTGTKGYLIHFMFDLVQFTVFSITFDTTSINLANLSMTGSSPRFPLLSHYLVRRKIIPTK